MPNSKKCVDPKIGDWVIMMDNEIIECNSDIGIILEKAKKYQEDKIIVTKVPSAEYCFY